MPTVEPIDPFELWFKYEQVAMHFNELLIRFRIQLLGGAGALGTIAASLIATRASNEERRFWLRALVSSGLWVLLVAGAILDWFYYQQLLRGAVDALLALEQKHPELQLSTTIERTVGCGKFAPAVSYLIALVPLSLFTVWSWIKHVQHEARPGRRTRKTSKTG